MKVITVRKSIGMASFEDSTELFLTKAIELMPVAEQNRSLVIYGASQIEERLIDLVDAFFSHGHPNPGRRRDLVGYVFRSSWCGFNSKIQLAKMIAERVEIHDAKWRKDFGNLLMDVMQYRNKFAHGAMATDGKKVALSSFISKPTTDILTDQWLSRIEADLGVAYDQVQEVFDHLMSSYELHPIIQHPINP